MRLTSRVLQLILMVAPSPVVAEAPAIGLPIAIASQLGDWEGKLEYRDYQADKWFGIPVEVKVADGGDGVTQIRTSDFDDGPRVGIVRITTVTMMDKDGVTEHAATFRKGRKPDLSGSMLTLKQATDATHWTLVSSSLATDANRPARIRITTTRDGDAMSTMKEVDFTDDATETWLERNRTVLTKVKG
jgi:hypothetical protein